MSPAEAERSRAALDKPMSSSFPPRNYRAEVDTKSLLWTKIRHACVKGIIQSCQFIERITRMGYIRFKTLYVAQIIFTLTCFKNILAEGLLPSWAWDLTIGMLMGGHSF